MNDALQPNGLLDNFVIQEKLRIASVESAVHGSVQCRVFRVEWRVMGEQDLLLCTSVSLWFKSHRSSFHPVRSGRNLDGRYDWRLRYLF